MLGSNLKVHEKVKKPENCEKPLGLGDRKSLVVTLESQGTEWLICELYNTFVNYKPVSTHINFYKRACFTW